MKYYPYFEKLLSKSFSGKGDAHHTIEAENFWIYLHTP